MGKKIGAVAILFILIALPLAGTASIRASASSEEPRWKTYTTPDLVSYYVSCLAVRENNLWVGTKSGPDYKSEVAAMIKGGLSVFNNSGWSPVTDAKLNDVTDIMAMVVDSNSNDLYVGTNIGLRSFDGSVWKNYNQETTDGKLGENYYIQDLAYDKDHRMLWITAGEFDPNITQEDLDSIQDDPNSAQIDPNSIKVSLIQYDISDNIWTEYTADTGGLPSNYIMDIAVDSEGNLWVSTYDFIGSGDNIQYQGNGLTRFNVDEEEWTHYTTESNNEDGKLETDFLNKIYGDQSGRLWVGGMSLDEAAVSDGGLYQFDLQTDKWVEHYYKDKSGVRLGSNWITALCLDGADLWVGTAPPQDAPEQGGASLYNGNSWELFFNAENTNNGLIYNAITAIAVQGDYVWFGTPYGLCRYYEFGKEGPAPAEPDEPFVPMDPNRSFRFPGDGCFTASFSNVVNQKSILNLTILHPWRIFFMIGLIFSGIVFFYILRRYLWVRS